MTFTIENLIADTRRDMKFQFRGLTAATSPKGYIDVLYEYTRYFDVTVDDHDVAPRAPVLMHQACLELSSINSRRCRLGRSGLS